ncbi:MAG: PAS domain-containing protein [Rhodobacter sp.]|nr:PAS domain-containing protein [Rhodobacter sp.]
MLDEQADLPAEMKTINSIIRRMDGFLYRCRNDRDYSMSFMAGNVVRLTGFEAAAFTGPTGRSYSAMTHPDDLEAMVAAVDRAILVRGNWHVDYRICRGDGTELWVHEIGGGIYRGDELLYLEGVVIDSDDRRRADRRTEDMLAAVSEKSRLLLKSTDPIVNILRTLRILAINARLEAGRAGPAGASFGFVAHEVSRLSEETAVLAEAIAIITAELNMLLA